MAQHDYVLENAPGAPFRTDLNAALAAIQSQNSGATEPGTRVPGMLWLDLSVGGNGRARVRNQANDAWVDLATVAGAAGNYVTEAPNDAQAYLRKSQAWSVAPAPGIGDAPNDGQAYNRKSQAWAVAAGGGGAALPAGIVFEYAGAAAPPGYLLCYGQAVSRTTYAALFTAIGTAHGAGDGSTTFNVPDHRGRVAAGKDDMGGTAANRIVNAGTGSPGIAGNTLGAAGGADRLVLTVAQLATHNHGISDNVAVAQTGTSAGRNRPAAATDLVSTSTGGNEAHPNMQPTIIMNFIITTGA